MSPLHAMLLSLRSFWSRGRTVERTAYLVGALLVGSGLIHLGVLIASGGSWEGPLSFRKPTVFGLSFGMTLITVAWTASFLTLRDRARAALLYTFTAASVFETALVSVQTWRGVPSHFNLETPVDSLIARSLAGGGFVLVVVIVVLTLAAFRKNQAAPSSMLAAIRVGFAVLCGAMATGGAMIARGMTLVFAGDSARAYATGGSLKPTHALTMHAILILPALAWVLSFANWSEQRRLRAVRIASAAYLVLTIVVGASNIAGVDVWLMPKTIASYLCSF